MTTKQYTPMANGMQIIRMKNSNHTVDIYYGQKGHSVDTHRYWDRRDVTRDVDQRIYNKYHQGIIR
jgi:hypothetical protein